MSCENSSLRAGTLFLWRDQGLIVRTRVRAGSFRPQHSQTLAIPTRVRTPVRTGELALDRAYAGLIAGQEAVRDVLDRLLGDLWQVRRSTTPATWKEFSRHTALRHPLKEVLHRDPFTRRSFDKPRGYAGDAELLDFIYGFADGGRLDDLARSIFGYTINTPASRAVRARKELLAASVDRLAERTPQPKVLSVACGHLREAWNSTAVAQGQVGRYVALDQDPVSLDLIRRDPPGPNVITRHAAVRDLLSSDRAGEIGRFDFVYAAGLYDYLPQPLARRLTSRLFDLLVPGGTLLVANFLPQIHGAGYMETYMAWFLIFRDADMLADVARDIPAAVAERSVFVEENDNVVFLELVKA